MKSNTDIVVVEFAGESGIEDQISKIQDSVEATLDGSYNALVEDMKGFKEQWDEEGYLTLGDGVIDGAIAWGADIVDMVSPSFWGMLLIPFQTLPLLRSINLLSIQRINSIL